MGLLHAQLNFPRFTGGAGPAADLATWGAMAHAIDGFTTTTSVALVGKYTGFQDAYLSVLKALKHAAARCKRGLRIVWVESSDLEDPAAEAEGSEGAAGGGVSAGGAAVGAAWAAGAAADEGAVSAASAEARASRAAKHEAAWAALRACDGVLVPGGFGGRGVEGKVLAARYARTHKVPFLGVCLGFQLLVVEFARSVLGRATAQSAEFAPAGMPETEHAVVFMPEIDKATMGGNMRLGARDTVLHAPANGDPAAPTLASLLYGGARTVSERHRHRYTAHPHSTRACSAVRVEQNMERNMEHSSRSHVTIKRPLKDALATPHCPLSLTFIGPSSLIWSRLGRKRAHSSYEVKPLLVAELEARGLNFTGRDETGTRMEVAELPACEHPFYLGVQYHPEFKSRPLAPSPPFLGLLLAASGQLPAWRLSQAAAIRQDEATSAADSVFGSSTEGSSTEVKVDAGPAGAVALATSKRLAKDALRPSAVNIPKPVDLKSP